MVPFILGVVSAALFLGLSMIVYGPAVLAEHAWVALVFSGLIGAGFTVSVIDRTPPRWLCRLQQQVRLADDLCPDPAS
jgi:hypothetical protein